MLPISDAQKAKIIAALKQNSNASAIARLFGLSKSIIAKIAHDENIELAAGKKKGRVLPQETYARIFAELKTYPNAKAVAEMVGVNQHTVGKVAKRAGIELTAGRGGPRRRDPKMSPVGLPAQNAE